MRNLIAWRVRPLLARRPPRLADHGERGAIGVLVAILVGGGVLVGMGALVVDVGQVYQNRAELQNGADAAALAVAKSCVQGACDPSIATGYADANASQLTGHTAKVDLVCGSGTLGTCPPSTGKITDCPPAPPAGTNYVDVYTSTELANGSTLLPPVFARTLAGNGSYQGTTVGACARAEWGTPQSLDAIGITISECIWDNSTDNGQSFAQPPPYPPNTPPDASDDQTVYLKNPSGYTGACSTLPNGSPSPGNFGWTSDPNNPQSCNVVIDSSTDPATYGGSTGASANNCSQQIYDAWYNKTVVYIPVFYTYTVSGTGNNTVYQLEGFAPFVITGYDLSGMQGYPKIGADWLNPANPCTNPTNGSSDCLAGYFTHTLLPTLPGPLGGTPYLGLAGVKLTG